jgi:hypothetical protein
MKTRGITLVELVLTIALTAAVSLVVFVLITPVNNVMFTQWRRSGVDEGKVAMSRMISEIERIGANTLVTTYTGTHLVFTDVDGQGVDFQKSGTDLTRNGDVLARNVQTLLFEYLDTNGVATAVPGQMRVIRVTLVTTSGNQTISLQSSGGIRNL